MHCKKGLSTLFISVIVFCSINAQQKKIGVYCKISGPVFIERGSPLNFSFNVGKIEKIDISKIDSKFLELFQFYKKNIPNPTEDIRLLMDSIIEANGLAPVIIQDDITNDSLFPIFKRAKTDISFFIRDLRVLKEKYAVDSIIVVRGEYGFELEKLYFDANGDKRNSMSIRIMMIDLNSNRVRSRGHKNIVRNFKPWNQPPDYPALVAGYNDLYNGEMIPIFKEKMTYLFEGRKML